MRLILFVFCLWSAAATAETRLALLISNEKYPEKAAGLNLFGPLGKAHRDREQMAEALKQYRFEITEVLDADKDKMDVALVAFTEKLEKSGADSVGVIYFVGHGAEVGGELYLIPTQEKHADDKAIRNRAIKANELIDRLTTGIENGKNQGVRLLILDACRSRIKTRGVNERKVDLNAHGALVGYAAASGKEALDSDDSYTMHLTKQMKINGHLKIEEVFKKARIELAKASGNNQISLEYGGLLGDFCLDNCQSNPLEKDLKAKEQELADLKQKLAQNTINPNEINELKKRLEAIEKQSGMSGMSSNDGMKGMSGMTGMNQVPKTSASQKIERYISYGDNTVFDTQTNLMWISCAVGQTWNQDKKTCQGVARKFTWKEAKKQTASVGDYKDWRLPTRDELISLMYCSNGEDDIGHCNEGSESPTIAQREFPNTPKDQFWSGTLYPRDMSIAGCIDFSHGSLGGEGSPINEKHYVRLVRGGGLF